MPNRAASLDLVRLVGIVAIIAGHVWRADTFARYVYCWHVPIFFFLTGWLWKSGRSFGSEARSRARTLLVPYLSWLVVLGVASLVVAQHQHQSLAKQLEHLAWSGDKLERPFSAFWFVTALFAVCLLRRALDRFSLVVISAVAILLLALSYPVSHDLAKSPESIAIALPALVFLVAGEWARRLQPRVPSPGVVGVAAVVVPLIIVGTTNVHVLDLKVGGLGTPVVSYVIAIVISFGLVLLAMQAEAFMAVGVREVIIRLASVGLAVILGHAAILWAMHTPVTGRWPDFVVACVVAWGVALVISRTPLARLFIAWPSTSGAGAVRSPRPATQT